MPTDARPLSLNQAVVDLQRRARRQATRNTSGAPIWEFDTYTITGSGDTTHTLTYLPYGINVVLLNGLGLVEGTDYSCAYTTGVVTVTATLTAGDVLHVRYVTTGDLMVGSLAPDVGCLTDTFNRTASSTTPNPASDGGSWTTYSGTWGIDGSNHLYCAGATPGWTVGGTASAATGPDPTSTDSFIGRDRGKAAQDVTVDIYRADTTTSRIFLNFDPTTRGAYVFETNGTTLFRIFRSPDNTTSRTLLGTLTFTAFEPGMSTIRLVHDGHGVITAYQGGTLTNTFTDTSPLTGTWVALGITGGASTANWFDNFQAC